MPGARRYTRRERRMSKAQRIAIAISSHCAKPKNRRTKLCRTHFKIAKQRRR